MSAAGPNAPPDPFGLLTRFTSQQTTTTTDIDLTTVFAAGLCRRVVPQASGTIFLQRDGDSAALAHVAFAGQPIDGQFVLIGGTTNYPTATSALVVNCEI